MLLGRFPRWLQAVHCNIVAPFDVNHPYDVLNMDQNVDEAALDSKSRERDGSTHLLGFGEAFLSRPRLMFLSFP